MEEPKQKVSWGLWVLTIDLLQKARGADLLGRATGWKIGPENYL